MHPSVEMPSGKDVAYENFPVGSWLLPAELRPHIAVFYEFARAADDIADDPTLPAGEKVARLNGFEDALLGSDKDSQAFRKAHRMRQSLAETEVTPDHCVDLLAAFKQDALKQRYRDWSELIAYCRLSAASVGRYLLDLHGGGRDGYGQSDSLCIALQIINHLQDCKDDYLQLDRVYLPQDWMAEEKASVEDLGAAASTPALRRVLNRVILNVDVLVNEATALPGELYSRRLAMESAAIVRIAERLSKLLRVRDPLASRIELTKAGYLWCCLRGVLSVFF